MVGFESVRKDQAVSPENKCYNPSKRYSGLSSINLVGVKKRSGCFST